jgi:hypothetical protein
VRCVSIMLLYCHDILCRCNGVLEGDARTCSNCAALVSNLSLKRIVERVTSVESEESSKVNDAFCSHQMMGLRRDAQKQRYATSWLDLQNALRKVQRLTKAVSLHKRLLTLLEKNDVPKLRQTISVALRNGCSVSRLIDRISDVISKKYKPRGDYSKDDYDLVTLIIRLGGTKLLFAFSPVPFEAASLFI